MIWADIQTTIASAVKIAADDTDLDVEWGERGDSWRAASHVVLRLVANARRGRDERRYTASGTDDVTERIYGTRRITVQVTCETDDADLDANAAQLCETIAAGFSRTDVEEALAADAIGVPEIGAPRPIGFVDDQNRTRSVWVVDLIFNVHASQGGATIPRVKAVAFSATIEDGADIPETEVTGP